MKPRIIRPKTIVEKIWENKEITSEKIKVDLHLLDEKESSLILRNFKSNIKRIKKPNLTYVLTKKAASSSDNNLTFCYVNITQIAKIEQNKADGLDINFKNINPNIINIISPELGLPHPGKVIVSSNSQITSLGAFGALTYDIYSREREQVFSFQSLYRKRPKIMNIQINGFLSQDVSVQDLLLSIAQKYGTDFAENYIVEFTGIGIKNMTMEERMTICGMVKEIGAETGIISPDEVTLQYLKGRHYVKAYESFYKEATKWLKVSTDMGAVYDKEIVFNLNHIKTNMQLNINVTSNLHLYNSVYSITDNKMKQKDILSFISPLEVNYVFIGLCNNSRLSDLRKVAELVKRKKVNKSVKCFIIPSSYLVEKQAEKEGIDIILREAGFEWFRAEDVLLFMNNKSNFIRPKSNCIVTSVYLQKEIQQDNSFTFLASTLLATHLALIGRFHIQN